MKKFKNRYGNEYWFEQLNEDTYVIRGDLKYWRFGGKEGEDFIDNNNLGFADPSGGPFIAKGYMIDGRSVLSIAAVGEEVHFKVV
jgi:hypothetical protein